MKVDHFIKKFEFKSDVELETIAENSKLFVLDARLAAVTLLSKRNVEIPIIATVYAEAERVFQQELRNKAMLNLQKKVRIERLKKISVNRTRQYRLHNGNKLQVQRWSRTLYQVRIEDSYRSNFAPVLICILRNNNTFRCYPFLYLRSVVIYGLGGTILLFILFLKGYVKPDIVLLFSPLLSIIGFQILMMPVVFYILINHFEKRLGRLVTV